MISFTCFWTSPELYPACNVLQLMFVPIHTLQHSNIMPPLTLVWMKHPYFHEEKSSFFTCDLDIKMLCLLKKIGGGNIQLCQVLLRSPMKLDQRSGHYIGQHRVHYQPGALSVEWWAQNLSWYELRVSVMWENKDNDSSPFFKKFCEGEQICKAVAGAGCGIRKFFVSLFLFLRSEII